MTATCDYQTILSKNTWLARYSFCIEYNLKGVVCIENGNIEIKRILWTENKVIFIEITFQRRHIHSQRDRKEDIKTVWNHIFEYNCFYKWIRIVWENAVRCCIYIYTHCMHGSDFFFHLLWLGMTRQQMKELQSFFIR